MNTRIGHGAFSPQASVPPSPSAGRGGEARPSTPASSPLAPRSANTAGSAAPRSPLARDIVRSATALPLAAPLAGALVAAQAALANVEVLFGQAAQGEPLRLAVAEDTVRQLLTSLEEDAEALVSLVRLKAHDDYACMHSVAVCVLMASLAREMRLDRQQRHDAALAGLLHDIGKAFIPARVFAKPGRLTEDEFAVVRGHPQAGFDALDATAGMPAAVKSVAHQHHERPDGRGYPQRLVGHRIALLARMGAVCDVYDAITSNRPYKDGWDPGAAMQAMGQWTHEGQFDARVTAAFRRLMGEHPIGSLVRLRSERLGVVNATQGDRRGGLSVTAFYSLGAQQAMRPEIVEVGMAGCADAIVGIESNAKWRFRGLDELWAGDLATRVQPPAAVHAGAMPPLHALV